MARRSHTILGGFALNAALLVAAAGAAPAGALTPPPDDGPGFAPNQPLVSIHDTHAYEADGVIQFGLQLSKPSDQITFVHVARTNDTTSNADFSGLAAPMAIFAPGVTSSTISFHLTDDDGTEDPETMTAEITSVTGDLVVNDGTATGTIYDADGPVLGADMDQVDEGDPGDDVSLSVEVHLSYAVPQDITFDLTTQVVGSGAVPGDDFEPVDDTFTVPAGSSSVIVPIAVVSDDVVDDDDGVVMAIASNPSIGSTWNNTAVGKIVDDDEPGDGAESTPVGPASGTSTTEPAITGDPDTATDLEVAQARRATAGRDSDGSGVPFLPIAALLAAGAAATWFLVARDRDDDATPGGPDATGRIRLD